MINDVVSAVCGAIFGEFGAGYEIYDESIEQGLNEPCFFVRCVTPFFLQELKGRSTNTFDIVIKYFPESENDAYKEINDVIERLYACLKHVNYNGLVIEASDISTDVIDRVLTLQAVFTFNTVKTSDEVDMENYEHNEGVKNG